MRCNKLGTEIGSFLSTNYRRQPGRAKALASIGKVGFFDQLGKRNTHLPPSISCPLSPLSPLVPMEPRESVSPRTTPVHRHGALSVSLVCSANVLQLIRPLPPPSHFRPGLVSFVACPVPKGVPCHSPSVFVLRRKTTMDYRYLPIVIINIIIIVSPLLPFPSSVSDLHPRV